MISLKFLEQGTWVQVFDLHYFLRALGVGRVKTR
jgi:hypothetical protein